MVVVVAAAAAAAAAAVVLVVVVVVVVVVAFSGLNYDKVNDFIPDFFCRKFWSKMSELVCFLLQLT